MPELPEVEVICRGVRPYLLNRTIKNVASSGFSLRKEIPTQKMTETLIGQRITAISRRAKFLEAHAENGAMLIIHFGMTGNLGIVQAEAAFRKHDHCNWLLDDGSALRYHDPRRFGQIIALAPSESEQRESTIYKTMGPDPLKDTFSAEYLMQRARGRSVAIKIFLMNSQVVCGIGNIYANESLFAAGIAPQRAAGSLSKKQWQSLVRCIREVLARAIECGGSTIRDFVNVGRESGYFQMNFKVYGKNDQPCSICGAPLLRSTLGGRATYFCKKCQR